MYDQNHVWEWTPTPQLLPVLRIVNGLQTGRITLREGLRMLESIKAKKKCKK
jgi:hypothetical protein